MKILVLSDTHRAIGRVISALNNEEKFDYLIHLGDNTQDADTLSSRLGLPLYNVRGNCDYSNVYEEQLINIAGKNIFLTHGHNYRVNFTLSILCYRAEELNADICLYGHTHITMLEDYKGILIFNPGSIPQPRGGKMPSYGVIEINNGEIKATIREVN